MSILVSGSLTYDHIMNFPDSFRNHILPEQIHILNVGFTVDRLETSRGGTASNIAFTMKLLGADPIIVSAIGKDGTEYLKYLDELGLSIKYILKDDKKLTASAHITTDVDDNQITAFYNGALDLAEELSPRSISEEVELALISPMPRAVMIKHLKECFELGLETVFDPGQQITVFNEQNLKTMISQAHFVIGNDYEIKLLERRAGWDAAEILRNTKVLITTLGERGSVIALANGETIEIAPCPPRSFDDPTGAGDAYRAGFFTGYELGFNWKTCGQMGSVAASYAIETRGTQEHTFSREEFCDRYQKTYQEIIRL